MTELKDNELAIVKAMARDNEENKEKVSVQIEIHGSTDLVQSMVSTILFSLSGSRGIFANLKMAMKCIMARRSRD